MLQDSSEEATLELLLGALSNALPIIFLLEQKEMCDISWWIPYKYFQMTAREI